VPKAFLRSISTQDTRTPSPPFPSLDAIMKVVRHDRGVMPTQSSALRECCHHLVQTDAAALVETPGPSAEIAWSCVSFLRSPGPRQKSCTRKKTGH